MVLWNVVFALVFPPLILLVVLLLCPERARRTANRVVERVLFFPVSNGLPLIKLVLTALILIWLAQAFSVYRHAVAASIPAGAKGAAPSNPNGVDGVMFQGKGWRSQRNLYLTSLALVLWWMLYSVHVLSEEILRLRSGGPGPAPVVAPVDGGGSSARKKAE